VAITS
jgi:ABC-type branched-subunit amino acid transport system substrate-binding protein